MDDKAVTSSYAIVRDSKRDTWILTCPIEQWRSLRSLSVSTDRRPAVQTIYEAPRSVGVIAPLVVLLLTVARAVLLHALRRPPPRPSRERRAVPGSPPGPESRPRA